MEVNDRQRVWLSTRQVAERLGVSIRTLERMRRDGGGPAFSRRGSIVRYEAHKVDEWMRGSENVQNQG